MLEVILTVNGFEIDRVRIVRIRGDEGDICEYKIGGTTRTIKHDTRLGARSLAAKALRMKVR